GAVCSGVPPWLFVLGRSTLLTARWCLLILLCAVRQVLNLTEQPSSSVMQYFPYFKFVVRVLKKYGLGWFETSLCLARVAIMRRDFA
ncbi:unnamed protein product, partial [Durusdinium trenchii]